MGRMRNVLIGIGLASVAYGGWYLTHNLFFAEKDDKPKVEAKGPDTKDKKTDAKQKPLTVVSDVQSNLTGRLNLEYDVRCFDVSGRELEFRRKLKDGSFSYDPVDVKPNQHYTCKAANSDERVVEVTEGKDKHLIRMELIADKAYPLRGFEYDKDSGDVRFAVSDKDNGVYRLTLPVGRVEGDKVVHRATRTLDFVVGRKKESSSGEDLAVDRGLFPGFGLRSVYGHR